MAKQLVFDEDARRMNKGVKISATMCWQIVMRICLLPASPILPR